MANPDEVGSAMPELPLIIIQLGDVALRCEKGYAVIPIREDARSPLASFIEIERATRDLLEVALPERPAIIVFTEGVPTTLELGALDDLRAHGASLAAFSTPACDVDAEPARKPAAPAWPALRRWLRPVRAVPAELTMVDGVLRVTSAGGTYEERLPVTAGLVIADGALLHEALLRAVHALKLPDGARLSFGPEVAGLTVLERVTLRNAIYLAQMTVATGDPEIAGPRREWVDTFMWTCIAGGVVLRWWTGWSFGVVSTLVIGVIIAVILSTAGLDVWRHTRRLKCLLRPDLESAVQATR